MIARYFFILTIGILTFNIQAQNTFESSVFKLLQKPDYVHASVGILVKDLNNGNTLYSLNPDQLLIPASTMKLITTASALEILGNDYRFHTHIAYSGKIGEDGVLDGDLIVVGGADPALGSRYFQDHYFLFPEHWARQVKAAGIWKITGNLILNASIYDKEKVPKTWIWEDIGNYYGAGANAFTVNDNMFYITFRSPQEVGKATTLINTYPKVSEMTFDNQVLSSADNRDNAYVFGSPLDKKRVIRGTIPAGRNRFTIKAANHHPGETLAAVFQKALVNNGIFISGEVEFDNQIKSDLNTIYIQESPKLAEIAKVLNYESVNLFAEHFLKQIAVAKNGLGNREEAVTILKDYWKQNGISPDFFMEDGSGLSHFNAVSPRTFVQVLTAMKNNDAFIASLPGAGEGTLYHFDSNRFKGRTLHAKSGSMTRVRCYSGFLNTDSGAKLVFSIMFNHFSGSQAAIISEIEDLLEVLKIEH